MKFLSGRTLVTASMLSTLTGIAAAELSLQYENGKDTISSWIAPKILLTNDADTPLDLADVVIEYYFEGGSEYETSPSDYTSTIWYSNAQDEDGIELTVSHVPPSLSPILNNVRSNYKITTSFSDANYIPAGGKLRLNYGVRRTDWEELNNTWGYSFIESDDYVINKNIIVRNTATGETLWGTDLEGRFETFWEGGYDSYEFFERSGDEILTTADNGYITNVDNVGYIREGKPEESFAFIVKTDRSGEVQWQTELADINSSTMAEYGDGYVVVGAKETYSNNIDPWQWDLTSSFEVMQLSASGEVVSSYSIPTDKRATINKMMQLRDGSYLVLLNEFDKTVYHGVYNQAVSYGALIKLNADLSFAWFKSFAADTYFTDIDLLFPNRVAITGANRAVLTNPFGKSYYAFKGAFIKELDVYGSLVDYADYPQVDFGNINYHDINVELGDTKTGSLMLAYNQYEHNSTAIATGLLRISEYTLEVLGETLVTGEDAFEVEDLIAIRNRDGNQSFTHHMIITGDNKLARMEFNGPLWIESYPGADEESDLGYSDLRGVAEVQDDGFVMTGHQVFGENSKVWLIKVGDKGDSL